MSTSEEAKCLFQSTNIAGPMVRASSHLFRISCLHYGADVVFSPGIVDLKLKQSTLSEENGHAMFKVNSNGHNETVLDTCEEERGHFVLQIISNNGSTAVEACQKVLNYIDGVDLNCGCPEQFATHRNCGSSMELETAIDVIKTLKRNIQKPISVKFRIRDTDEESIQFAQAMEKAGADAITVHGRLKEQKHKGIVDYDKMKLIFESINVLKIGNGGVCSLNDATIMREKTGCSGVMISHAAMENPSIFSEKIKEPVDVLREMSELGQKHNLDYGACRFTLQQILQSRKSIAKTFIPLFNQSKTWSDFDNIFTSI